MTSNVTRVEHRVQNELRRTQNGHGGGVFWFTGLSASGKSTLAIEAEARLFEAGYRAYMLDGDNLRHGLNSDLGFSQKDRAENIRRVGELAALFADAGMIVICAFISPYRVDRDLARKAASGGFHEVFIKADLATCEARDVKDLYRRARAGEIPDFTGISAPYEAPDTCELVIDTNENSVAASAEEIICYIREILPLDSA